MKIPGFRRMRQSEYADTRGGKADRESGRQPELDWYMERYPRWRSLFDGRALEEKISVGVDPATKSDQEEYRWPVRMNLVGSYCRLYAGLLWGRGTTKAEADELFTLRVDPKGPNKAMTAESGIMAERLNALWSYWFHILRMCGVTQQWAGGCALKVAWNPVSPLSVMGLQLQFIQPEHFYPIWNPLNFEELIAVRVKFSVSRDVAIYNYNVPASELDKVSGSSVNVEEYWDRSQYYVVVGRGQFGPDENGIVAKIRMPDGTMLPQAGKNPFVHPRTGVGVIPFVYVPRLRTAGFFGDSLAYHLDGIQSELNKTLADVGDALTGGTHPAFGISDYHRKAMLRSDGGTNVILIPTHGALFLGETPSGRTPPKVHEFPKPEVPAQTPEFLDSLLSYSEMLTGLTPAARGAVNNARSGFAVAMELLPTTTIVDWERSHWTTAIAQPGGINEIASVIWYNNQELAGVLGFHVPQPGFFHLRQSVEYKPVLPRDRLEVIDEVVRLATANAVSPQEWLKRLGDVDDIDQEYARLAIWLAWLGQIDAARAGRALRVSPAENTEEPSAPLPEVAGTEIEPKSRQPARQPQGQKPVRSKSDGGSYR